MTDELPSVITFDPPLPCVTVRGLEQDRCGKPARTGSLTPWHDGLFLLQPFCEDCVRALQRLYFPETKDAP